MSRHTTALVLFLLLATPAVAHDYWLLPETFFPGRDATISLHLHVGEHLVSEVERPFQAKPTVRFEQRHGKEVIDLAARGTDGKKPVARLSFAREGTHLVLLERAAQLITLDAAKFNKYLEEEGLQEALDERKRKGEEKSPGRERYSRYLKSLLQVGKPLDDEVTRPVGHKLEIVPLENPYSLRPGDTLTVRVLFEDKPLAKARLAAHHREGDRTQTQSLTTTKDGEATIKLDHAGPWLVRLVHMRRCQAEDADWESFWLALTFAVGRE
jgi:uncharacterized GH25 family protein